MINRLFTSINSILLPNVKRITSKKQLLLCNYKTSPITYRHLSTIYALSSGSGKCGVSIIRVSGPKTSLILTKLIKRIPKPRYATYTKICFPDSDDLLDKGIVVWYPS